MTDQERNNVQVVKEYIEIRCVSLSFLNMYCRILDHVKSISIGYFDGFCVRDTNTYVLEDALSKHFCCRKRRSTKSILRKRPQKFIVSTEENPYA